MTVDPTPYFDAFVRCASAPLLLPLFPNLKEITESFACFNAVRKHLPEYNPRDPNLTIVCVADGSTPRTAATFCLQSSWQAISIDPNLRARRNTRNIKRLTIQNCKVEETQTECDRAIIVCCHSHANLVAAVSKPGDDGSEKR